MKYWVLRTIQMILTIILLWLAFDFLKGSDLSWIVGALAAVSMAFLVAQAAKADEEGL